VYEIVWFVSWVSTHPFDLKFIAFRPKFNGDFFLNFQHKTISGEFFRNFVQTKDILYQNLWNLPLISAIFFRVRIALKKFTQVLSYVVCTQVRRHVHKQITKRRYGEEKPGRFVFGKLVLFTLGLGLTTPCSLGILVWNFYQTFVTVSVEFWLIFEPQIRPTGLAKKKFIHHCQGWKEGSFVCETVWFFSWVSSHPFDLKFVPNSVEILTWIFRTKLFRENFSETLCRPRLSSTKTFEISPYFLQKKFGSVLRWKNSHKYFHMLFAPW